MLRGFQVHKVSSFCSLIPSDTHRLTVTRALLHLSRAHKIAGQMNNTQRAIATVGLILLIAVAVYPPWTLELEGQPVALQYSFVWKAPQLGDEFAQSLYLTQSLYLPRYYYAIDRDRLMIPWLTVLIATIGFVKIFEREK